LTTGKSIFATGKSISDSDDKKSGIDLKPTSTDTRKNSKSNEALLFDEDDISALEALAAAEEDI
jgi:hypothetical protein